MKLILRFVAGVAIAGAIGLAASGPHWSPATSQQPPPTTQPPPSQPQEVTTTIRIGGGGAPPRFAVPDFIALSTDAETIAVAKTIAQVLWDDLTFEREFSMIPRDTYATIPVATSLLDVPFDRWREMGADGVVIGSVQKTGSGVRVQVRLYEVAMRRS